ncbi:F-box/LRR-repeat protein, partial [Trifolium medium]|nr:F-box/LRR-repeat protein [Trifolium medium]
MNSMSVTDLSFIADRFPLLEELHLNSISMFRRGNMLNGIETLSLALSKLRK